MFLSFYSVDQYEAGWTEVRRRSLVKDCRLRILFDGWKKKIPSFGRFGYPLFSFFSFTRIVLLYVGINYGFNED